ncbi:nuclear factor 7, brain-like [Latimeria chalumnae]|uniref:nuclear factor 7, brain-like n=1 Tax=Latimeria chalumnae TaxID=7897 RepID=UPI00313D69AF
MTSGNITDDLICAVCLDFFRDPVMLDCGHNFCRFCISKCWGQQEENLSCPECREVFLGRNLKGNRALGNMADKARRLTTEKKAPRDDSFCAIHENEELTLFCENDLKPICLSCTREHQDHKFVTMQSAVKKYQEELSLCLTELEEKIQKVNKLHKKQEWNVLSIGIKYKNLEDFITKEFTKLYQFLKDEEEALKTQLLRDKEKILKPMQENLDLLTEDKFRKEQRRTKLTNPVNDENKVELLKEMKNVKESSEEDVKLKVVSGNLSLGVFQEYLSYLIWRKMKKMVTAVPEIINFDMETAHPKLEVSSSCDIKSVFYGAYRKTYSNNTKRFNTYLYVLGSTGFTSGRHYWEVEVRNKTDWDLGVVKESVEKTGNLTLTPENGIWRMKFCSGKLSSATEEISGIYPSRVGVFLDYEEGLVSFYNADDMALLFQYYSKFTEKLYPLFCPCNNEKGDNSMALKLHPPHIISL